MSQSTASRQGAKRAHPDETTGSMTETSSQDAALWRTCYITDRNALEPGQLLSKIDEAARAGVDLIQIREKDLETRPLLDLVQAALGGSADTPTRIIVNDRLDVAMAAQAAGVHLGHASLPPHIVRRVGPPQFLVGVSCHSLNEALAAESAGADYILLGPIFETPSKRAYGPPLGLETLREVAARLRVPSLALGGITVERVLPCLEAGATGIAGITIFQNASCLEERMSALDACFAQRRS